MRWPTASEVIIVYCDDNARLGRLVELLGSKGHKPMLVNWNDECLYTNKLNGNIVLVGDFDAESTLANQFSVTDSIEFKPDGNEIDDFELLIDTLFNKTFSGF